MYLAPHFIHIMKEGVIYVKSYNSCKNYWYRQATEKPALATRVYSNSWEKTQKAFVSPSQNKVEKEEEKNKKKIAKLFALHVNAKSLSSLHFLKKVRSIAKHVHEE